MLSQRGSTGPVNEGSNAADADEAAKSLAAAEYDRTNWIKNREARRLISAEEYNAELASLTESVTEARIAYEMTQEVSVEPPTREVFQDVWDEWTDGSRREFLSRFLSKIIVRSANRRRVPVSDRIAVKFNAHPSLGEYWLLPGGNYARQPFGDVHETSRVAVGER